MAYAKVFGVGLVGLHGHLVEVEADITAGLPTITITGLPDAALNEARDRVRAAVVNVGEQWPMRRITVNLLPASLPKHGSIFDLPLAVALLTAAGSMPAGPLREVALLGELGLDGAVRPVRGVLPCVLAAARAGVRRFIVPLANAIEAQLIPDIEVRAVECLGRLIGFARGTEALLDPDPPQQPPETSGPDLKDVVGQALGRRAIEIAAAGGHHLAMIGPPGAGKTMLAQRICSILPPLNPAESLEVTAVHSIAGLLRHSDPLIRRRPFQAPHHTISVAALIGGGSGLARPGALSLAHCGVLFLDDLTTTLRIHDHGGGKLIMQSTRPRVGIYVRISADREGRELGVERQEEDCRRLADRLRLDVHGIYGDNDISASTRSRKKRPNYQRMLADARAGWFTYILAYTSSRITRKPREHEDLIDLAEQHGISFQYVQSPSFDLNTANGRMVARMLAAADANQAEVTSELILRKQQERAEQGRFHGGARPYGYEADGVSLRPVEVAIFKDMVARIIAGESQVTLIKRLNDRSTPSCSGKLWTVANLKRVLLKKRYVIGYPDGSGIREHSSGEYKAEWPGIISMADHELMVARFRASGQPWAHGLANGRKYLLSGLTRCGRCGQAMYGQCRKVADGHKRRRYRCKGLDNYARAAGCGRVYRDAAFLDDFVTECLLMRFDAPEIARALTTQADTEKADELVKELAHLNLRRKTLAIEHSGKPYDDYGIMREHIMREIHRTEVALAKLYNASARNTLPEEPLRQAWPSLSLSQRRDIIKLVVDRIVVKPGCSNRNWERKRFDPDLIEIMWRV